MGATLFGFCHSEQGEEYVYPASLYPILPLLHSCHDVACCGMCQQLNNSLAHRIMQKATPLSLYRLKQSTILPP